MAGWYSDDWPYRVKVTIDRTKVGLTQTGLDVEITEANVPAGFWAAVKSDGSDIVVTESDGETKLYRDLISIDTGAETLRMRVGCDVSTATDTDLYLYYGNSGASETANQTQAYHSSILNYWTLDESPGGAGSITDRTGNNHGTPSGVTQATGKLGNSVEFDGTNTDEVDCGDLDTDGLTEITVQCWAYLDTRGGHAVKVLLRKAHAAENATPYRVFDFNTDSNNDLIKFAISDGTNPDSTSFGAIPLQTWTFITGTFDGVAQVARLYLGTTLSGSKDPTTSTAVATSSQSLLLGRGYKTDGNLWDGRIDEVRILDREMESGEITTRYNNESSPSTFYSCGSIEVRLAGSLAAQSSTGGDLTVIGVEELAGTVTAQSSIAGGLEEEVQLGGTVTASSSAAGYLLCGVGFDLSGALQAQAGAIGRLRGGTPIAIGPLRLLAPDGAHEIRRVPFDWLRPGQAYTQDLELEAPEGHPNPVLWTDRSGWLEVQVAGGAWKAVGSSRASGVSLGGFSAGQRKTITFRVRIPGGTEARGGYRVSLPLNLEVGT